MILNAVFFAKKNAKHTVEIRYHDYFSILEQSTHCTTCSDYRVVQMFARHPWQRDLPSWYPPIGKYDTILRRLRQLGLYGDGHLVGAASHCTCCCAVFS